MLALANPELIRLNHVFESSSVSPPQGAHDLSALSVPVRYSRGEQLCLEGHTSTGIYCISSGRAKEYFISTHGKVAILRISGPGDLIGLESMIGGAGYATTVEAIEPMTALFITKRDFLALMRQEESFRLKVTKQLSGRCKAAYSGVRQVGFAASIPARVAHFLLRWSRSITGQNDPNHFRLSLTHEEISQLIGSTRETVSRILARFRRRGWIRTKGAELQIVKKNPLSALAKKQSAIGA